MTAAAAPETHPETLGFPGGLLRAMRAEDADALARLEALVEETPWTRGNFLDSLASGHTVLVFELGGRIAAWAAASLVLDEAELLIIGTDPEFRRRGIARALMRALERRLAAAGAASLFLEVRESNAPARALYLSEGFAEIGRRRNYYRRGEGREDAVLMRRALNDGEAR